MKNKYPLMLLLLLTVTDIIYAQSGDTIRLKTFDVTGSRTEFFTAGIKTTLTDSSNQNAFGNQSLSDLLTLKSTVFIKSYGSGGSATISSRGTEARHNAVLWNGFNINSASLGLTDFSIIPAYITDGITLLHGGSSAINGNAAIGSTVLLENATPQFIDTNHTWVITESGSFGNLHGTLSSKWSSNSIASKTVIFYDAAENDFKYTNFTQIERPKVKQQHAAYSNYGLIQDLDLKIKSNLFISAGIWYQVTERELPSLMTVPKSYASQRDSSLRTHIGYKLILKKSVLSLKGACFREFQYYNDERYDLHLKYHVNNYFGEAEWRWFINEKFLVNTGINYNYGEAQFMEYAGHRNRTSTAFFVNTRYFINEHWKIGLNLRQEFTTIINPPLTPYLSLEGNLFRQKITILAQAGRNFSLPSMNDLYWMPGGNPSLKPEDAWSEEVSLVFLRDDLWLPTLTITAFNSVVDNWIRWLPAAGGIYSPDNLRQVQAKGVEAGVDHKLKINKLLVHTNLNYTWCSSSVTKAAHPGEQATIDKQLMYVPENIINGNITLAYQGYSVFYTHSYTSERFTTSDNGLYLPSYHVAYIAVEKEFKNKFVPFSIYLKIYNLYDATFQVMAYRPTPGRWYSAGVKFNFNIPFKQKSNRSQHEKHAS